VDVVRQAPDSVLSHGEDLDSGLVLNREFVIARVWAIIDENRLY